jgi:hypothetical protein
MLAARHYFALTQNELRTIIRPARPIRPIRPIRPTPHRNARAYLWKRAMGEYCQPPSTEPSVNFSEAVPAMHPTINPAQQPGRQKEMVTQRKHNSA